jgi:hypothetical protein
VQDVLIMYTASAATAAGGVSAIQANIQSAVQAANQTYQNSGAYITMNMVALQQSPVSESGSVKTTVQNFMSNSTVRSQRDKYGADVVVLVSQDSDYCGVARRAYTTVSGATSTDAYAVVYSGCLSNQSLAHEVGHLQGLEHNREDTTNVPDYPYGYGYRKCVTGGFRDTMSYPCPGLSMSRILNFSNPSVYYNGYPTGISYEIDPTHASECARALNNTATLVAGWRTASGSTTVAVPSAPTTLATTSVQSTKVSLTWADNSSNESGFQLERSGDGVSFTNIATLDANIHSATDVTVSASTTVYYRVRAYNSAGASAYSNTLRVTTPAVTLIPAAPAGVTATKSGSGKATVAWADQSGNETGFDVQRARWDSATKKWSAATKVGTVGANMTRFVDAPGKGKFRYWVRSFDAAGASAYVGPAVLTMP